MRPSRPVRWAAAFLALGGMVAVLVWWWLPGQRHDVAAGRLRPDDAQVVQRGAQVYLARCASCHGATLEGQPNWRERGADGRLPAPPHDESGHTWHHADDVLIALTKEGVARAAGLPGYATNMPAFVDSLSDADIVAVLSWIKSRWSPETRAQHDAINQQAAKRSQR
jgi:mono/diheme cytochrome c family protein